MKSLQILSAVGALLLFTPIAHAQVVFFGVQKTQFYTQTADDTAPGTPNSFSVYAFANTTNPGDATSFTVSDNDTVSLSNSPGNPTSFSGSNFYATAALMNAGFTSGDVYTFTALGGTLDGQSDALPITSGPFPDVIYLTGTGLTDAVDLSPNAGYTFDLGYAGTGISTSTSFNIFNAAGDDVYSVNGTALQSSYALSQSFIDSLTPGETYSGLLTDFNTFGLSTEGDFSDAANSDGFTQSTNFDIEVAPVPEPSTYLLFGLGALALAFVRRMRGSRRQMRSNPAPVPLA